MDSGKVLAHYDPKRSTRVYVDYSDHGVSGTLAQAYQIEESTAVKMRQAGNIRAGKIGDQHVDWRPVTHVSRSRLRGKVLPHIMGYGDSEGTYMAANSRW